MVKVKVFDSEYIIASLPSGTEIKNAFCVIKGKDETTVIAEKSDWEKISENFEDFKEENNFRLVLLDINLDWNVVGFLSKITSALAEQDISVGALSAYSKDYLLIKNKDIDKAKEILEKIIG